MDEVHKNTLTQWGSDVMSSILRSHMKVIEFAQKLWAMIIVCYLKDVGERYYSLTLSSVDGSTAWRNL